jgi:hypothetical protein
MQALGGLCRRTLSWNKVSVGVLDVRRSIVWGVLTLHVTHVEGGWWYTCCTVAYCVAAAARKVSRLVM